MIRPLLTGAQVARMLGYTAGTFYRYKRAQMEASGFPRPNCTGRYDPRAVELWLDSEMPDYLTGDITPDPGHLAEASGNVAA